jgi:Holliday junction resolvase RusA-like endonuclease
MPLVIDLGIEPIPWARAGRDHDHSYTPQQYREYRETLAWTMLAARKKAGYTSPFEIPLEVMLTFVRSTRRTVDGDNLEKAVLDAGTGVLWADDSLIRRCCWEVVLGGAVAGTTIRVQALEGST